MNHTYCSLQIHNVSNHIYKEFAGDLWGHEWKKKTVHRITPATQLFKNNTLAFLQKPKMNPIDGERNPYNR